MSGTHPKSIEKIYLAVFGALIVLTAISVGATEGLQDGGLLTILIVMGMATMKATLVALFFMHLKFEGRWKYVLVVPPVIMMILLMLALCPDIARWGAYVVNGN
jgi:cytochrome c oxidase subunit 4